MPDLGFKLRQAGSHGTPLPWSVLFDSGKHGGVRTQKEVLGGSFWSQCTEWTAVGEVECAQKG